MLVFSANAQNDLEWSDGYSLELSDFQSTETEIGNPDMISLNGGAVIDFAYAMSTVEFMATQDFNTKVRCIFKRSSAVIVAPDSASARTILNLARYQFDLTELYSRKLRQQLYESKKTFSDPSFFKPLLDKNVNELNDRYARVVKDTSFGRKADNLTQLHQVVKQEIEQLADFCKTCKPFKKKE